MSEDRQQDWDWVKATHECSALVMFGELKALARRDVQTRNAQLERETFKFTEINGIHFLIARDGSPMDAVGFMVKKNDLTQISIAVERTNVRTVYTVALDDQGRCKFKHDANQLDAWQVLKAALEPLLFG